MQIPVSGFAFPFPGQLLVMGHQTTQLGDVITLMIGPMLSWEPGQLLRPVEGLISPAASCSATSGASWRRVAVQHRLRAVS